MALAFLLSDLKIEVEFAPMPPPPPPDVSDEDIERVKKILNKCDHSQIAVLHDHIHAIEVEQPEWTRALNRLFYLQMIVTDVREGTIVAMLLEEAFTFLLHCPTKVEFEEGHIQAIRETKSCMAHAADVDEVGWKHIPLDCDDFSVRPTVSYL